MAYKKYREMKVYEASGYQYKRTPVQANTKYCPKRKMALRVGI